MVYSEITAIIKAFMRPYCLQYSIRSAVNAGINRIIIGYDGPDDMLDDHKLVIEKAKEYNSEIDIELKTFPFNYGLSAVRNRLVEEVNTKYLFLLDDDNYIPSNSLEIINFLEKHKDYGAVGIGWVTPSGFLKIDAYDFKIENDYFIRYINFENKHYETIGTISYIHPFDFIPNCAIYRTEVFNDIKWDENYIINREHEDFMLTLKNLNKWKLAIAQNLFAIHDKKRPKKFELYRQGSEWRKSIRYFLKKWNLKGIYPNSQLMLYINTERDYLSLQKIHKIGLDKFKVDNIYEQ